MGLVIVPAHQGIGDRGALPVGFSHYPAPPRMVGQEGHPGPGVPAVPECAEPFLAAVLAFRIRCAAPRRRSWCCVRIRLFPSTRWNKRPAQEQARCKEAGGGIHWSRSPHASPEADQSPKHRRTCAWNFGERTSQPAKYGSDLTHLQSVNCRTSPEGRPGLQWTIGGNSGPASV